MEGTCQRYLKDINKVDTEMLEIIIILLIILFKQPNSLHLFKNVIDICPELCLDL